MNEGRRRDIEQHIRDQRVAEPEVMYVNTVLQQPGTRDHGDADVPMDL